MAFNVPDNKTETQTTNPPFELRNSLDEVLTQDQFFKEMSQDKENFEFNKDKFNDPPPSNLINESSDEKKDIRTKAEKSAAFVVKHLDNALAWGASEIALAEKSDDFKASEVDKKEMIIYWADILEVNKGNIPNWLMLLISASLTYGPLYREAFKARAINKEIARRAAKAEAQLAIEKARNKKTENSEPKNDQHNKNETDV